MTYHVGFLYLADQVGNPVEIVNEARTAANLQRAINAGAPYWSDVSPNFDCQGLAYEPCTVDDAGAVTAWATLDTSLTGAPWFRAAEAWRSEDAHGFLIEEWTGLDAAHMNRALVGRGNPPYGAVPGLQSQAQRVMQVNVIAVGASAHGLQYLFRWLESTLVSACSLGSMTSLYLREDCPVGVAEADLEDGLVRLDDVVLVAGPTWESAPLEEAGCHVRRISFTLAAGNPCLHRVPSTGTTQTSTFASVGTINDLPAQCDAYLGSSQRNEVEVPLPAYGSASAIVTIKVVPPGYSHNFFEKPYHMPAMRILGVGEYYDRAGVADPCIQPRVGLFTLDNMESGWEYRIDCATGEVIGRDLFTDRKWIDASFIVMANEDYDASYDGLRNFTFTDCLTGWVIVEPALSGTDNRVAGAATSGVVDGWSTTITPYARYGCV